MSAHTQTKSNKTESETHLSDEQRRQYIEVAAYHRAEKRGFDCTCDQENWLAAEAEIERLLAEGKRA